ncbi:MAG TPA: M1 family aminopeptidase [Polyangiaceae bacterium]|nr:M1 family aminopeptidase [Polyangiaceae bacterium]
MKSGHRLHERCACSSAGGPFVLTGTTRKYERSRPFTITHLFLDLALDFEKRSVHGTATLDFERRSREDARLELDARAFDVQAVELQDSKGRFGAVAFDYDGEVLTVSGLGERGKLRVRYSATPRRGLYFLRPDDKVKDRPRQVWSQCQDEDARHWFPCLDKPHVKMTTELRVAVPHGYSALSNGELKSQEKPKAKGAPWVYHFALEKPHPSYLVTLVAGEFDVVEDRPAKVGDQTIPVTYYLPRGRKQDAKRSLGETPNMIELFSRLLGVDYPWERYSQVVVSDFIFGGMENTTATTLYEHALVDERGAPDISANDLVAHELAHQWFGDFVTCRDWSHAWLNEGFATYFEHVEREHRLGRDEYDYGIAADLESYLGEVRGRYQRPIVCRDYSEPIDLFDRHLYEKGSLVLHMLRRELGDALFFEGVRRYLERHAHGIVETTDLMRAFEEVSGRSLERFFDDWVYRPGHPDIKVKISWEDGLLSVNLKQKQKGDNVPSAFSLPLEIEVVDKQGKRTRHQKIVSEEQGALSLELDARPKFVVFDPDFRVIGNVTIEAPGDMLRAQLREGSTAYARFSAADALARRDEPPTIRSLGESARDEKEAWMVRAEAARALGKIRAEEAFAELAELARTEHPKVRRAVMSALGAFKKPEAATVLAAIARKDPSYLVEAEAARALGRTKQPAALRPLLAMVDRASWGDVTRAGALDGMAALRDEQALDTVIQRTAYGYPTRGRRAAIAALAALSDSRRVREHLENLLEDRDPHLKIEVVAALERLGDTRARGALRRLQDGELDGRVLRRVREAIRELGDSGSTERKRLHDEVESLREDLAELKTRLSKIESLRKKENGAAKPAKGSKKRPAKRGRR